MAKQVKIPMPVPLKRSLPLDGPHKKRVYVVSGIVLAVVLIIVALVVTIVLATTSHAQDHDPLLDSSTKRLPEVLTIAFNIGYQNESTKNSVDKSKKYVLKLANLLDFSANSLTVKLVPYSDDVDVRFKCSSAKEIADIVAKIEGKSLKGKNPTTKLLIL
uniref:Uncharacterized protein n=1 Tax=Panagrolaimus sp. JU765 TaxID=591449 RepID=A0AC34R3V4_9BILA